MAEEVKIKGIREGLLIAVGEGDWPELASNLLTRLKEQGEFLEGGRIALDVGAHDLGAAELSRLRDSLSELGLSLWAILGSSATTRRTAQSLGLATRLPRLNPDEAPRPLDTTVQGDDHALLVRRTLRSGFSLTHAGHVTVIGDVNPGAEVIAGGNVVVWGRLRGMVHAGAAGDEGAIVCALDLSPTQLRIAGTIAIPSKRRGDPEPEIAFLREGIVVAEIWKIWGR